MGYRLAQMLNFQKVPTPKELARINIDKQLEAAGWMVQDFKALNLGAG